MSHRNIHLPSIGVNLAVAGLYLCYMGRKKVFPAVVGLSVSAIIQGTRPPISLKKRDWNSDLKVLSSGILTAIGFYYSKVSLKTKLVAGSLLWGSQVAVKECFTQWYLSERRLGPSPEVKPDPEIHIGDDLKQAFKDAQALPQANFGEVSLKIRTLAAILQKETRGPGFLVIVREYFSEVQKAMKGLQGVEKAQAIALILNSFKRFQYLNTGSLHQELTRLISQGTDEEIEVFFQAVEVLPHLPFEVFEAFIQRFNPVVEGFDNKVGDCILLWADRIMGQLRVGKAQAMIRCINFLDSQAINNPELFQKLRELNDAEANKWLQVKGRIIERRWEAKK